jgi:hypothetical protein
MALRSYLHSTFDPRRIPGLAAWYDAADSASITLDSGRVSQWSDKSGNARHATNTTSGSTQPSYTAAARNGLNVVRFAAASTQRLSVPSSTETFKFLHDGTQAWWIAVNTFGTVSNPAADYYLFSTATGSAQIGSDFGYYDVGFGASDNNAAAIEFFRGAIGTYVALTANPTFTATLTQYNNLLTPNTLLVNECALDLANATASERVALRVNGGSEVKANTRTALPSTANASNNLALGAAVNAGAFSGFLQGDICELMFFNQQPTAAARDLIRRYLGAKWGVTVE